MLSTLHSLPDPDDENFGVWMVNVEKDGYIRIEKCAAGATGLYLRRVFTHPTISLNALLHSYQVCLPHHHVNKK